MKATIIQFVVTVLTCYSTVTLIVFWGGSETQDATINVVPITAAMSSSILSDDVAAISLFHDVDQDPNQPQERQRRQLQSSSSTPLIGVAIQTSVFDVLTEVALFAVNQINTSELFGDGLTFEFPATDNFVFGAQTLPPVLTPFSEDSITISILQDTSNPDSSILIRFGISDLGATFPTVVVQANGTVSSPLPVSITCFITWTDLTVSVPPPSGITITLNTTATGSVISAAVAQTTVSLETLSIPLSSNYTITGNRLCSTFQNTFDAAIRAAETVIVNQAINLVNDSFINSFTSELGNLTLNIPPLDIGAGNVELGLAFDIFGVSQDNQRIQIATSTDPKAIITSIPHRIGFFYKPPNDGTSINIPVIPSIINKTLAGTIALDGLNDVVASAFYLIWADLTINSTSVVSKACEPIVSDPCPFPELELVLLDRRPCDVVYRIAFLALRRFFRRGGFYDSFRISVVVTPPTLTVTDDGIGGSVIASLYIQAVKRFKFQDQLRDMAKLDFPLVFQLKVPTITNEGMLEDVGIDVLTIGNKNDGLDFHFFQPFPFRPTLRSRITLRLILLPILRKALPKLYGPINESIARVVSTIVIPTSLEPIQFRNITLQPKVSDIALTPDGDASTLSLSANIQLLILS